MKKGTFLICILMLVLLSGCGSKNYDTQKPILGQSILGEFDELDYIFEVGGEMPDWLEGVEAFDYYDGYLTDQIQIDATDVNMNEIGDYQVTYTVRDKAGKTTKKIVPVRVRDLTSPIIMGFSEQTIGINYAYKPDLSSHVTVKDQYDGVITDRLTIDDSKVQYKTPGTYPVFYQVDDLSGNSSKTQVTLTILDETGTKQKPIQIGSRYTLSGNDPLYGDYTIEVMVNHVEKGSDVVSHSEDDDYILTNLTVKLIEIDEDNEHYMNIGFNIWDDLLINSYLGLTYDPLNQVEIPNPLDDCNLKKNESCTGNLIYSIDQRDQLLLKIASTYFRLTDDKYVSIGSMINLAKSDIDSMTKLTLGTPIFEPSLFTQYPITKYTESLSKSSGFTTKKYIEFVERLKNLDFESNQFIMEELGNNYIQYDYQFYNKIDTSIITYFSGMRSYYVTKSTFLNHLTNDFLTDLNLLSTSQLNHEDFFNRYGTHFITKASYGVKRTTYCIILADKDLGSINSCKEASIAIPKLGGTSTSTSRSGDITLYKINTIGGARYTKDEGVTDSVANNKWINALNNDENHETSVLIELNPDDYGNLVPIWDLLPPEYEQLKDAMEIEYQLYYDKIRSNLPY
jgi:Domain of unknown function (DUF5011)/MAC/Perforin domain